jgi:hypothetical protein
MSLPVNAGSFLHVVCLRQVGEPKRGRSVAREREMAAASKHCSPVDSLSRPSGVRGPGIFTAFHMGVKALFSSDAYRRRFVTRHARFVAYIKPTKLLHEPSPCRRVHKARPKLACCENSSGWRRATAWASCPARGSFNWTDARPPGLGGTPPDLRLRCCAGGRAAQRRPFQVRPIKSRRTKA